MSASMLQASRSCCSSWSWCMCLGMLRMSCWRLPSGSSQSHSGGQYIWPVAQRGLAK